MISILLVDDHPVVREGVAAILGDDPELRVVGEACSGEEALKLVAAGESPDIVVIDVRLPGMTGIEVCGVLRQKAPRTRCVVFTSFPSEAAMMEAFSAGAKGFLAKESGPAILRAAIHSVAAGDTYIDPRIANKMVLLATKGRRAKGPFGLTMQEMRVVELLPKGLTNVQIGKELGVSEQTVKSHLYSAMRKLQVSNRAQAAAFAQREGLA